jgi:hypothetical protein
MVVQDVGVMVSAVKPLISPTYHSNCMHSDTE